MKIARIKSVYIVLCFAFLPLTGYSAETCIVKTISGIVRESLPTPTFKVCFKAEQSCNGKLDVKTKCFNETIDSNSILDVNMSTFDLQRRQIITQQLKQSGYTIRISNKLPEEAGDSDPLTRASRYEMYFDKD